MKAIPILIFTAFAALAGCTDPEQYPISGQECSPDDPVHDLSASDCIPPV